MELTSIQIATKLRDKLGSRKYTLKMKSINDVVQAMYHLISKHKMWDELKETKK